MKKPVCFVGIALHPGAEKKLSEHFEVTCEEEKLFQAEAAIVYGVPENWTGNEELKLKAVGCHACSSKFAGWAVGQLVGIPTVRLDKWSDD